LRFGSQDLHFIQVQFKIIAEEAYHFSLLQKRLNQLNCKFGSLPIHMGLWDHAWKCKSELEHQIVIPCHLEARGLDVSPQFIQNFRNVDDESSAKVLEIILRDEIQHVRQGIDYINTVAKKQGESPEFCANRRSEHGS